MRTDNWDDPDLKDGDWVKAWSTQPRGYCPAMGDYLDFTGRCSRPEGHDGQHVATAGTRDGYEDVCTAWSA